MSPEVYIFLLVLGIPIFFLCRSILKNKVATRSKLNISSLLATIILAPVIYICIILIWVFTIQYYPTNNFDKEEWFKNKEERYELSEDIIESGMLIGKTKNEVKNILGEEGNNNEEDVWTYELGFKPQLLGIDPDILSIEFQNDKVVKVSQYQG